MQTTKTKTTSFQTLRRPVSQLAKMPCPTLQPSNDGHLTVGRQQTPLARKQASKHAPDYKAENRDFKADERENNLDFAAMKYLNRLLDDLLPELKICFHNPLYAEQIQTTYSHDESQIFIGWVKTFALLRRSERTQFLNDVVITDDEDFLSAFKLMQQRKIAQIDPVNPQCKRKVLDLLKIKFQQRTFTAQILARELFYNYKLLNQIIMLLQLERKIEFVKEISGHQSYRLRKKPVVYVD